MKPQRRNAGDRKSQHHSIHPNANPLFIQSAVECAHQESVSTATNERTHKKKTINFPNNRRLRRLSYEISSIKKRHGFLQSTVFTLTAGYRNLNKDTIVQ